MKALGGFGDMQEDFIELLHQQKMARIEQRLKYLRDFTKRVNLETRYLKISTNSAIVQKREERVSKAALSRPQNTNKTANSKKRKAEEKEQCTASRAAATQKAQNADASAPMPTATEDVMKLYLL